jgi:hypothetical protein
MLYSTYFKGGIYAPAQGRNWLHSKLKSWEGICKQFDHVSLRVGQIPEQIPNVLPK